MCSLISTQVLGPHWEITRNWKTHTGARTGDSSNWSSLWPSETAVDREDSGADEDAHEEVDPAQVEADFMQYDGQDTHEDAICNDNIARNPQNLHSLPTHSEEGSDVGSTSASHITNARH
jgi:hypothetical protein